MSFSTLGLSDRLLQIIENQGFKKPFPIQKKAIPAIINKKDVLGIAETGSGKTAGYVLPILMNQLQAKETKTRHVNTLVLVPTRELAKQVVDIFQLFSKALEKPVKARAVFGGVSINPQMKGLFGVKILVATPGRLLELIKSNAIHVSEIETLVIDEADEMLKLGFKDEMSRIFTLLPKNRQNLLFSATLTEAVKNIEQLFLKNPLVINVKKETTSNNLIQQQAYFINPEKKGPLLRHLIKSLDMHQVLVFTSTVQKADQVANKLRKNKIDAYSIHGHKNQGARTDLLTKFKHGKIRVLVTTDLLARGVDIKFLPYVVNYELPRSPKDFTHRIGRTGRAESPGKALSLITPEEISHFKVILKKMGVYVSGINGNKLLDT